MIGAPQGHGSAAQMEGFSLIEEDPGGWLKKTARTLCTVFVVL